MRKTTLWMLLSGILFLGSCKSDYEKVRTSGDVNLILNKAFEYYDKKQWMRSQTLFDLVINSLRGDKRAEEAYFKYAYTYYNLDQFLSAAHYFKNFSNLYVNSTYREEASYMSAFANYKQSPVYRLDQSNTLTAIEEFQLFVNLFPESKRVEDCNKLIDELRRKLEQKAFAEGELYYNLKQYQSSVASFDNLLRDYPESPDAERVRYLIAKASFMLSENSIVEKKEERYKETTVRCNDFLEKYSSGKYAKEIKDIRKASETELKNVRKLLKTT
jgi:outer membrane protein assembly factor BamD